MCLLPHPPSPHQQPHPRQNPRERRSRVGRRGGVVFDHADLLTRWIARQGAADGGPLRGEGGAGER